MGRLELFAVFFALQVTLLGCGGGGAEIRPEQWRSRLGDAMSEPVGSRDARDAQSRLLEQAVDEGEIDGLNKLEVQAAFGPGKACRLEICSDHGFSGDDWSWEIGNTTNDEVKQLPILIVGFVRGMVARVWTLTTH